jgi:two-component system OmpR family sensor kinase
MTIRVRLTLIFAVLMALVLAGVTLFVHVRVRAGLDEAITDDLQFQTRSIVGPRGEIRFPSSKGGSEGEQFAQLLSPEGAVLRSTATAPPLLSPGAIDALSGPRQFQAIVPLQRRDGPARLLAVPVSEHRVLVVGESLEDRQETLGELSKALTLGGSLALVGTTILAWLIAGAALRPVERMRAEASEIATSDVPRRLSVPTSGDEIERLGTTLNAMLDRLEQALERERRFVADASHELRTPLGILKTELDLALRRARTPEELEAALRSAAEESDRLNRLAEDLLVLARADHGQLPIRRQATDVAALIDRLAAGFEGAAAGKGVSIERRYAADIQAIIDPDRIGQALSNLLDNALRHTPEGGAITVAVSGGAQDITISVSDTGDGFPGSFLGEAFEAFARADEGRGRAEGATGLGLAIVRAIAEAHGGVAIAANIEGGGASVTLVVPAERPTPIDRSRVESSA